MPGLCGPARAQPLHACRAMKLLLDENLSRRLVPFLQSDFPGSSHVSLLGLEQASDREIWDYARVQGFVIVTRDADFSEISSLHGQPPQVIWLRLRNTAKAPLLNLLCAQREMIEQVLQMDGMACVELTAEHLR